MTTKNVMEENLNRQARANSTDFFRDRVSSVVTSRKQRSASSVSRETMKRKPSIFDRSDLSGESDENLSQKSYKRNLDPVLEIPKNVREMHAEMLFDRKLREKATLMDDKGAVRRYKLQKKWLSGLKAVTIVLYYLIDPIF